MLADGSTIEQNTRRCVKLHEVTPMSEAALTIIGSREQNGRSARAAGTNPASGSGSCGVAAASKHGESALRFTVKGVAQRRL